MECTVLLNNTMRRTSITVIHISIQNINKYRARYWPTWEPRGACLPTSPFDPPLHSHTSSKCPSLVFFLQHTLKKNCCQWRRRPSTQPLHSNSKQCSTATASHDAWSGKMMTSLETVTCTLPDTASFSDNVSLVLLWYWNTASCHSSSQKSIAITELAITDGMLTRHNCQMSRKLQSRVKAAMWRWWSTERSSTSSVSLFTTTMQT